MRLFKAGLTGRVPMGAGAAPDLVVRGGEPPGEELEVRELCCAAVVVGSKSEKFCALDAGEELLLARERGPEAFGEGPLPVSFSLTPAWF